MSRVPLSPVITGQPLRIPAPEYNAILETTRARRRGGGDTAPGVTFTDSPVVIECRNVSGQAVLPGDVLGLVQPTVSPTADADYFRARVRFDCDLVDADTVNQFAVVTAPANDDEVVRAVASGVVAVQLELVDAAHEWARGTDGEVYLTSCEGEASARILWRESDTPGRMWALVRLSNSGGGGEVEDPVDLDPSDPDDIEADVTTWDRDSQPDDERGFTVAIVTRTVDDTANERLIEFRRVFTFDDRGHLKAVGAEVLHEITETEECDEE